MLKGTYKAERLWMLRAALALTTALTVGVAGAAKKVDLKDYDGSIKADELFIVDCLLPPQVRQMGQRFTYLAARQPIRTSARECAIRGGEYVAYDRASLSTALKVWLPAAEGGDAVAQTHLGEIYEQGLGVEPDFELAVSWYQKAVKGKHSRAMINLGSLYERGLGVPRDMTTAMNLYRQASGITDGILEFTTDAEMARRRALAQEAEQLRSRVLDLTGQLATAEKALDRRKRDLRRARDELARTLADLEDERATAGQLSAAERQQLNQLRSDNQQLRAKLQTAEQSRQSLVTELKQMQQRSESAELELQALLVQLDDSSSEAASREAEVEKLRHALQMAQSKGSADADEIAAALEQSEAALADERDLIAARQNQLNSSLADARAELAAAREREAALRGQLLSQNDEMDFIRSSLGSTQDELAEAQLQLAAGGDNAELVADLKREIAERQAEIAQYEANSDELLDQLVAQEIRDSSELISMISPEVGTARGARAVTLFSDITDYELIGRVSPSSELLAFRVNDRDELAQIDANGLFKVAVRLEGMETPVAVEAIAVDGTRTRETFVIQKDLPQAMAQRATSRQFRGRLRKDLGNFHALVIGNNNYAHHDPLKTAVNDAQDIADVLQERYGFNVRLLLNATRDQMVFELARLTQDMGKNDNVLVYYAGHGVITDDGEGHWLGVEASKDGAADWIANSQISDFISEMQAKHVLVVADSCYSGTLSGSAIRPIPLEVADQDLLFISRVRARTVLTSGGLQPVLDDGGEGHSIFGGAFLRAISGNADVMEGYRLFETLQGDVETRSRLAQLRQSPEYTALKFAGHEGSEFFFLPSREYALRIGSLMRL